MITTKTRDYNPKYRFILLKALTVFVLFYSVQVAQSDERIGMQWARASLYSGTASGKIYAIGGAPTASSSVSVTEEYDPKTDSWTTKTSMPKALCAGVSATVGDKIYIIGGATSSYGSAVKDVFTYDPVSDKWEKKGDMPSARIYSSVAVADQKIYVISGASSVSSAPSQTVEMYDPKTDAWSRKADMPTGRWGLVSCALEGKIYVMGGLAASGSTKTVEIYDPSTDAWTTAPPLSHDRRLHSACALSQLIYTFGGIGGAFGSPLFLRSVEALVPGTGTYVNRKSLNNAVPVAFQLFQNYPNPFNLSTTIQFDLPETAHVRLSIYNLMGQEIAVLADGKRAQGTHEVHWDGEDDSHLCVPSGAYLYRLDAAPYSAIGKLLLLK